MGPLLLLLLACDPLADVRDRERRYTSAEALAADGLDLAPVSSGEALPPTLRVSLWADHVVIDNRAWVLTRPEAVSDPAAALPWVWERTLPVPTPVPRLTEFKALGLGNALQEATEAQRAQVGDADVPAWAWDTVFVPDADAPAGLLIKAMHEVGAAGRGGYQFVGRQGDRPVGVLASRADGGDWQDCLAQVTLAIDRPALMAWRTNVVNPPLCQDLDGADPASAALAVQRIHKGCAPRWAAATPELAERGYPAERWACLSVIWTVSDTSARPAGDLLAALGAITALGDAVVLGAGAISLGGGPRGACPADQALDALEPAAWDALCGVDATWLAAYPRPALRMDTPSTALERRP